MIYQIKNHKILPLVNQSGKRYKFVSNHEKKIHTAKSKLWHKYYNFYQSTKWKKLSRSIRKHEPLCRACVREYRAGKRKLENVNIATSVDHIVPLKENWSKRYDLDNLQPICHDHHLAKDLKGL